MSKRTLRPSKTTKSNEIFAFLKNPNFACKAALGNALGLSWASFGRSWGSPGNLLGSLGVLLKISWGLVAGQGTILASSWVLLLSFFSALLVRSSSKSLFFFSWGLLWSIWVSKITLRPSKSWSLAQTINTFSRINVFDPKMFLKASEGSLGPLLRTLGGLLEAS